MYAVFLKPDKTTEEKEKTKDERKGNAKIVFFSQ
jgi:hypothetical protein